MTRFTLPLCSALPHPGAPETPISAVTSIIDLTNVSLGTMWSLRHHLQQASELATAHYPETLHTIAVVNAPSFFPTVWGWIKVSLSCPASFALSVPDARGFGVPRHGSTRAHAIKSTCSERTRARRCGGSSSLRICRARTAASLSGCSRTSRRSTSSPKSWWTPCRKVPYYSWMGKR